MKLRQRTCIALLLLTCAIHAAAGRILQQEAQAQAGPVASTSAEDGTGLPDAAATAAAAIGAPRVPVNMSARVLTRKTWAAHGGAYAALGRPTLLHLKREARFVGSVASLAHKLETEKDLGVDTVNTRLLFQCKGLAANLSDPQVAAAVATATAAPALTALDPAMSQAQAFALSSRPTASRKIVLDFNGHTTTGSAWNSLANKDPIITPPYDKDGSPSTWSADELADIVAIWRSVAEDFAAFDVDVTTTDPGDAALAGKGVRVLVGGSWSDWYGVQCGGVAYVGSFGLTNTPAFIFAKNLGPNYAKFLWEAVSHETGHTLGLFHDGVTGGAAYYSGQGDWAPIMGNSYYKGVTQFDKGQYAGSNNAQDDLGVISGYLPLLTDGAGNSSATAAPLSGTLNAATGFATAKAAGVVSSAAGDWYSLQAEAGTLTLSVGVTAPWASGASSSNRANLDAQLVVYNAAGAPLATINPAGADPVNGLGIAPTAVALPAAGTYYVAVTGAGAGDPAATGYSSYGSRGQFELTATYKPRLTTALPDQPPPSTPPSPRPSPSPSPPPPPPPPPPVVRKMRVSSITIAKVPSGLRFMCSVTVYVRTSDTNAALPGVRVAGGWTSTPALASFAAATSGLNTGSTGTAAFRSVALARGYTCNFSISSVTLTGYAFDAASSVMTKSLKV